MLTAESAGGPPVGTALTGHSEVQGRPPNNQVSAFNPQEGNVTEDNPQDTKSSLSKNDSNFEVLVKVVSQLLHNKNFPFVLPLTKKKESFILYTGQFCFS